MDAADAADDIDPWRAFWLASELSPATGAAFAERINDYAPPTASATRGRYTYARADHRLARPDDELARLLAARSSERAFAPGRMSARQLGSLFAAFADADTLPRRRAWPSAGALYPLEIFALLLSVDHPLEGRVVHYESDTHGVTDCGPAPSWDALAESLSAAPLEGTPQAIVLFVLDSAAMEAKYGNRAGRFALIEVGHAAQNLALRLAADRLAGCELGGTHDRVLLRVLGLETAGAFVALGYACGLPAHTTNFG